MSDTSFSESLEIKRYKFNKDVIKSIGENELARNLWPLIYIISDDKLKEAYVGETSNVFVRMESHLSNRDRNKLSDLYIITCDKFNKSATLDIEANLIAYISADKKYQLQNGNAGLIHHNYYQKQDYIEIFGKIWQLLEEQKITINDLKMISNTDLFKYSPYKSLSNDQYHSIQNIIKNLIENPGQPILIEGCAGTGKTVLAIFLLKLLKTKYEDLFDRENIENNRELDLIRSLKEKYSDPKVALVVPMTSLRNTLKDVFKKIKGLKAGMVIGPSEVFKKEYDILIIDESHRLRRRENITSYESFDKHNKSLDLDNNGTELDWVLRKSKSQIFFYDPAQSIKPSDVKKESFDVLFQTAKPIKLHSQLRIKGGTDYINYVDKLLNNSFSKKDPVFYGKEYEFFLFNSFSSLLNRIEQKEKEFMLCRIVAGYAWKWVSREKDVPDMVIEGIEKKWNSKLSGWIHSPNAINEIGCIHTTQGYDLNYAGVIFGKEITYDPKTNRIVIVPENYHDIKGKAGIENPEILHWYIINIYKTLMYRGILGTYVYVCDDNLREYFKKYIPSFEKELPFKILQPGQLKTKNSVQIYDLSAAAGGFSELQINREFEWAELPDKYRVQEGDFICKVIGESMNQVIPSGSWCLFRKDQGGSREGKIVLAQHYGIHDDDLGFGLTIKYYHSKKSVRQNEWSHKKIILKPKSYSPQYQDIVLEENPGNPLNIAGIFVCILD